MVVKNCLKMNGVDRPPFLNISEAKRVAVSLGLTEDSIELPKC